MGKRKLILLGVVALLLVGLTVIGVRTFLGEADGVIESTPTRASTSATIGQRITVSGRYASFSYPTKFITQPTEAVMVPVLERYNFRKQQVNAWQIAITITALETGRLDDDGSYNYRQETPARFDRQEQRHGANEVVIFTDRTSDAFSKVAFLQDESRGASIAISGGTAANMEQIEADFEAIIASWQWR